MPMDERTKIFFDTILTLDAQIKKHIIDFDPRIYSLYDLKKGVMSLGRLIFKKLKESEGKKEEREEVKGKTLKKIVELKTLLALNFQKFLEKEAKGVVDESKLIEKEEDMLKGWEAQQLRGYEKLKDAPFIGKTKEEIEKIMEYIKKEMEHEAVDISMDKHLRQILSHLNRIITNETRLVKEEYNLLKELETRVDILKTKEETERIEELMTEIKIIQENIDREHRTEKIQAIRPLYKFLRKKNRELRLIKRHIKRDEKITQADISKDVHTFTDSTETQRYISSLTRYWDYLDARAKKFVKYVGAFGARAGEKEFTRLAGLVYLDSLTMLKNKRAFDEAIISMIDLKKTSPTSMIMIDIDHFKEFNDRYDHQTGNKVLKFIGYIIKNVNGKEFSYRYGGEELAVLLPGKTKQEAAALAEETRREVEEYSKKELEGINKEKKIEPEKVINVITISAGVAEYPRDANNSEDLIDKADAALYRAKDKGRNRVIS